VLCGVLPNGIGLRAFDKSDPSCATCSSSWSESAKPRRSCREERLVDRTARVRRERQDEGFWISIAFFPLFLWAGIAVPRLLEEKARQTRYFAMVDHSQEFGKIVDASIASEYERKKAELALAAFNAAREKAPASRTTSRRRSSSSTSTCRPTSTRRRPRA
jgi:hypothetical protein